MRFEKTITIIFDRMEAVIRDRVHLEEVIREQGKTIGEKKRMIETALADLTVAKQELEMVRNQRDDLSKQLDYRRAGDKSVFDLFRAAQAVLESENAGEPRGQLRKAISRMSSAMLVAEGVRR